MLPDVVLLGTFGVGPRVGRGDRARVPCTLVRSSSTICDQKGGWSGSAPGGRSDDRLGRYCARCRLRERRHLRHRLALLTAMRSRVSKLDEFALGARSNSEIVASSSYR